MTTTTQSTAAFHLTSATPSAAPPSSSASVSRTTRWIGRIAAGLGIAFMSLDCVGRLLQLGAVVEGSAKAGYFGGAIATHMMLGHPLLTHTLFPLYVAALIWAGALIPSPELIRSISFGLLPQDRASAAR